jgi:hypothetical protein
MADRDGFIPVQRRSNRIQPPKIVPLLPPVSTTLITQSSVDPNRFIENVRAEVMALPPDRSIPRAERTEFHIGSALYDVCEILLVNTPNLVILSSKIPLTNITSISGFPDDDKTLKEFFHIDNKFRPNGGQSFFVYFSIESATTEGISNITDNHPIAQFLKENHVYFQPHDFNTFQTIILGSLFKKSYFHADKDITQVNLTTALYTALSQQMGDCDDKENPTDNMNDDTQETLVPYFIVIERKIHHITHTQPNDVRVRLDTKALMIRCSTNDADELSQLIIAADLKESDFGIFIPTKWANTMNTKYGEYIMAHNEYLDTIAKITVTGLHKDLFKVRLQYPEGTSEWRTIHEILLFEHFNPFTQTANIPTVKTNLISAIEETIFSESDGTWYFITTKSMRFETEEFLRTILIDCCANEQVYRQHINDSDTYHQGIIINTPLNRQTNDPFQSYGHTLNFPLARNPYSHANTSLVYNNSQRRLNARLPPIPPLPHPASTTYITQIDEPTSPHLTHTPAPQLQMVPAHTSLVRASAWPNNVAAQTNSQIVTQRKLPRTPWSVQQNQDNTLSTITQPTSTSMTTLATTINSIAYDHNTLRNQMQEFMNSSIQNQNIALQQQQQQTAQNVLITSLLTTIARDLRSDSSRKRSIDGTSPTDDVSNEPTSTNSPGYHPGQGG